MACSVSKMVNFEKNTKAIAHGPRAKIGDFEIMSNKLYHFNRLDESFQMN